MSFFNEFLTATRSLSTHKLRTFLTTLGIIIGVASVIAMLALGNGARAAVDANFRHLGSDVIQISSVQRFEDGEYQYVGELLSYKDGLLMPEQVALVDQVDMSVSQIGKARYDRHVLDLPVYGITASAFSIQTAEHQLQPVGWPEGEPVTEEAFLDQGRVFTPQEVIAGVEVCLLGFKTVQDLFEDQSPINQTVWVNRHRCTVIGVLVELETIDPALRAFRQPNEFLLMPISTAIHTLYDEEPSVKIIARVSDESLMSEARAQITNYLRQRHKIEKDESGKYQDDFLITTRSDILGAQQAAANTFTFLLTAMATVSLVVGGIGIMNIMLVSVTERTREIGIRIAVGARQSDILMQFLMEAFLISAFGGVLGLSFGILCIPFVASLNDGVALLDVMSIPLSFGYAIIIGILFGLYPAIRAARLDPIEALRYE